MPASDVDARLAASVGAFVPIVVVEALVARRLLAAVLSVPDSLVANTVDDHRIPLTWLVLVLLE
jgi:hypothetical protein